MSVFLSYQKRTTSHWYCNGFNKSPVAIRWDRAEGETSNKAAGECTGGGAALPSSEPQTIPMAGQILTSRVNTGPGDLPATSIGLALQQSFTIYVTFFHWDHAPQGYTSVPDK